jgi:microcystin-dependent protein
MDASLTVGIFPPGMIFDYAGTDSPGWGLIADGTAVSRTTYARLFAVLGTTYGVGDGSTTFNIPNLNGKTTIGVGTYTDTVSGSVTRTLGQSLGAEKHVLTTTEMPSHTHTQNAHSHSAYFNSGSGLTPNGTLAAYEPNGNNGNATTTSSTTATNQNTGGGTSHNNMQPSLVVKKVITF